jgi:hypothetical protein
MKEDIKEFIEKIDDDRFLEIIYNLIKKRVKK